MAFFHTVMFRWADDVDAEHIAKISAWLDQLPGAIPEIKHYHHGPDAGLAEGNFDYAVVGQFDDVAGYETYRDHPFHRQMVEELVKGRVAGRSAVQFES